MTKNEFDVMRLMVMLNAGYAYDRLPDDDRELLFALMIELAEQTEQKIKENDKNDD